jgi:hypothetical protein
LEQINCRICDSKVEIAFTNKVLNKYDAKFYKCHNCGFIFSENPFWLDEAYSNPINLSDTGLLERNVYFSEILSVLIYFEFNKEGVFLDYAGGYGVFTRLMRDIGYDFYWNDPYTSNLFSRGFEAEINKNIKFELITAFEVFEHLNDPKLELMKMLELSETVIFSTELIPEKIPDPKKWWYYGFEHGQHIAFYSSNTFEHLANKFDLNYYNVDGIQLLTKKRLNKIQLILLKKLRKFGLLKCVKSKMKSKTLEDQEILKNKF